VGILHAADTFVKANVKRDFVRISGILFVLQVKKVVPEAGQKSY
jgi:hypothetical protein